MTNRGIRPTVLYYILGKNYAGPQGGIRAVIAFSLVIGIIIGIASMIAVLLPIVLRSCEYFHWFYRVGKGFIRICPVADPGFSVGGGGADPLGGLTSGTGTFRQKRM